MHAGRVAFAFLLFVAVSAGCATPRASEPLPGDWLGGITLESAWREIAPAELAPLFAAAHARARAIADYTAVLETRERVDDALFPRRVMLLKVRHEPFSVAIDTREPESERGQRAWYDAARNDGELLAETPGLLGKLVGRLALDPEGDLALENRRRPITDIGLLRLVELLEAVLEPLPDPAPRVRAAEALVGGRPLLLVEAVVSSAHEAPALFRIGIDRETALATYFGRERLEPAGPLLLEEYLYRDLRLDAGLGDADFRPPN